jgi:DNA-binding transcriptional MerR regulator
VKIGEVAGACEVSVDTVRYYERRGLVPLPARTSAGYRSYPESTVERIRLARRLQALGMTLEEVAAALHAGDDGSVTCASERWRLESVLDRLEERLAELRAVRREVRSVLAACDEGHCLLTERVG